MLNINYGDVHDTIDLFGTFTLQLYIFVVDDTSYSYICKFYDSSDLVLQVTNVAGDNSSDTGVRLALPSTCTDVVEHINTNIKYLKLAEYIWSQLPEAEDMIDLKERITNHLNELELELNIYWWK